jgi:hypothetical protein
MRGIRVEQPTDHALVLGMVCLNASRFKATGALIDSLKARTFMRREQPSKRPAIKASEDAAPQNNKLCITSRFRTSHQSFADQIERRP